MSAGGREHLERNGDGAALDAYLDGQLGTSARSAFEARLAGDPALAAELDVQRRLDRSLRGAFLVPPFPGLPTNGHPTPLPRSEPSSKPSLITGPRAAAAAIAGLTVSAAAQGARRWARDNVLLSAALGVMIAGSVLWLAYTAHANRRVTFDEVYRDVVASPPTSGSSTAAPFESACAKSLGRALQARNVVPNGVQMLGVIEAPVLSRKTVVLRARVDGQDVLLFADRPEEEAEALRRMGGGCHLHLFRRDAGGLVLYELTPLDQPRLLDQYAEAPPTTPDCFEQPPGQE